MARCCSRRARISRASTVSTTPRELPQLPSHDIAGIETVEDLQKPGMEEAMGRAVVERMGCGDVAANLVITRMMTNAFLCSGDEWYRRWVVEHVEAWMERTMENGGIIPDNIGLSGEIGEYIDGKW